MKNKVYSNNYQVGDIIGQSVIVIIYNKYKFFINDNKTHR